MRQRKNQTKRLLSLVLAAAMLLSGMPVSVSAENDGKTEENLCAHHTAHTPECGYIESQEEIPCDSGCTDTDGDGVIDHEASCSYMPAVEGSPCQYVCEICEEDSTAEDTDKPEGNGVTESTNKPEGNGNQSSEDNKDLTENGDETKRISSWM